MAYSPRKRASRPRPRVRAWPSESSLGLLGFAGYKAGMTHAFVIDDRKGSPTEGQEIRVPVTAIDAPPMVICAVRLYGKTVRGLTVLTEVWAKDLSKDLTRVVKLPEEYNPEEALERAEELVKGEKISEIRVLAHTQPRLTGTSKKKPDLVEIKVGGASVGDQWGYAKELLGKEVRVGDLFKEGEYVDVISITEGKGFEGPVQRWGVKIQPRKVQKARRHVGAIGPWTPSRIMSSVPGYGQMGYHQRTELNKRILAMGGNGEKVTPAGGFLRYGPVRGDFVILSGSIPGPTKRMVLLRRAVRKPPGIASPPTVTYISRKSQQGV